MRPSERPWLARLAVVTTVALTLLLATPAHAEGHALTWSFPRFRTIEYGTTVAVWLELAFIEFRTEMPEQPRWKGPLPGDEVFHDLFRLKRRADRDAMVSLSDPLPLALSAFPLVIDGALIPLVFDDLNFDVFWQLTWINTLSLGVQGLMHRSSMRIAARERPETPRCDEDPEYHDRCGGRNNSFYGGHTGAAFAGAGLICAHHMHLPLFGGGGADIAACAAALTLASSTAAMRLMTDQHWFSDNMMGAAVGFAAGFGLPVLLHYRWPGHPGEAAWAKNIVVAPLVEADEGGLSLVGVF
jgi:hypothetical protein